MNSGRGERRRQAGTRRLALPRMINTLIYVVGFGPAVWTFALGVMDRLGADPVKVLEHTLGLWALRFLILTLLVTPLRELTQLNLLPYRRALGLMAFLYALLHVATYLLLDQSLDLRAVGADILRRPFITVGLIALATMLPLALTSNRLSIQRLGGRNWRNLHRLVYLSAIAAAVHFILAVKSWPPEPLIYAAIVALLLFYRLLPRAVRRGSSRRPAQAR